MAHKYSGEFTSRTKARKRAADVLFEADQRGYGSSPAAILNLLEERKVVTAAQTPLPEYSATLVAGVAKALPRIDALLEARTKKREFSRLPSVDLAVMRIAVWEMLENSAEVPQITAIDEAVAIVKRISTADSPSYVNAVLDNVRKDIVANNSGGEDAGRDLADAGENGQVKAAAADSASQIGDAKNPVDADLESEINSVSIADIDDEILDDLLDEY